MSKSLQRAIELMLNVTLTDNALSLQRCEGQQHMCCVQDAEYFSQDSLTACPVCTYSFPAYVNTHGGHKDCLTSK
jgi:hypothetical protein